MSKQQASAPTRRETGENMFVAATAELSSRRPLRNPRLREIGARLRHGEAEASIAALLQYLAASPNDPDALNLLAQAQSLRDRPGEALIALKKCLAVQPDFALARFNYANVLSQLHQHEIALKQLDLLLSDDPTNPLFRQLQATILESVGENARSVAIFAQLVEENPARPESWISYGHGLRAVGRQADCVAAYRQAIACRPYSGQAYWSLANMKTVRFADTEIQAMEEQLKRADIPPDERVQMQFALGKAYEDLGAFSRSFEQYAKANAAMRLRFNYDPQNLTAAVASNKALYTPSFLETRKHTGCPSAAPIFILGRPRSGSTLIEQILSSHSAIEGTAELPYIISLARQLGGRESGADLTTDYLKRLPELDAATFAELGERYLGQASLHRKLQRPHFIDKKPANFMHLGLIHLILPNAKIIDARRHPVACSFSMFKTFSTKSRLRLSELGRFYRDYVALMAHFDRMLPGRVHRVVYEDLISNPEGEIRLLLDYLDLPFEEGCLRFHETRRTVLTPSSEQVRTPISSEAVEHWKNYEPWLKPLIDSLGSAYSTYPAVPADLL